MLDLAISLCLATQLGICLQPKIEHYYFHQEMTPYQCTMRAQEQIPDLLKRYNGLYRIDRWTCKPIQLKQIDI